MLVVPTPLPVALSSQRGGQDGRGTTLPPMSGFPWTSLITAVVPATAVLAGAALTGRQNNQAGRPAALKAGYAGLVQAGIALEAFLKAVRSEMGGESRPGLRWRIRMILRRD